MGVPWERRAQRTREYLKVMKMLWTEEESEFSGEFCSFPKVRSYPKPVQTPHPPIIFGGESKPALRRVGEVGDGWFGVNVTPEAAKEHIERMQGYAEAAGRDHTQFHYAVSTGIGMPITLDEIKQFRDLGVHQIIVGGFPESADAVKSDIEKLAEQIVVPAANL